MKTITYKTMSITVSEESFQRWDDILCNNPFNYDTCFSMNIDGDIFLECDDINNLIEMARVANIDVNKEVMVNGTPTSCSELIAICCYVADTGATWDKETVITECDEFKVSWVDEPGDDDVPF